MLTGHTIDDELIPLLNGSGEESADGIFRHDDDELADYVTTSDVIPMLEKLSSQQAGGACVSDFMQHANGILRYEGVPDDGLDEDSIDDVLDILDDADGAIDELAEYLTDGDDGSTRPNIRTLAHELRDVADMLDRYADRQVPHGAKVAHELVSEARRDMNELRDRVIMNP